MRRLRIIAAFLALALLAGAAGAQAPGKLKVLIVTGQNNHDWRATTPVLKDILERSGRFEVTVNEHPEACTAADFAPYDAILSNYNNYNGPRWGAVAEQAFLDFIRRGKGLVVIHAANNAFTDWPEYVALIGGIWAGGAGHGQLHPFVVRIADHSHPITRAMSDFLHGRDELYHRLEMQPNIHLLATAYSAPEKGGTGRDEPVARVVDWQGGRCFHNVLGHSEEAMQDAGFVALVQRGTEWAATGRVSVATDVRTLVPQLGAEDEAARYEAKSRLIAIGEEAMAPLMELVAGSDARLAGEARDALLWIAQRWAGTPKAAGIESALITYADTGRPTEVRTLAARMLGLLGDAQAVPTLRAMTAEAPLREEARRALMQIPGREVTAALVEMLDSAEPAFAADILHALGARGDWSATPAVVAAAEKGNTGVRLAAVAALGQMGDRTAAEPLWDIATRGPAELRSAALDAYLRLGDAMLAQRQFHRGLGMFRRALSAPGTEMQQVAALIGLGRAGRPEGVEDIKPFLRGPTRQVQVVAAAALAQIPGPGATAALLAGLKEAPALRLTILGLLGQRGDKEATPTIVAALSDADEGVQLAAVAALGAIGDPSAAPALREMIAGGADAVRGAALNAGLDIADAQLQSGDKAGAAQAYLYAWTAARASETKARAIRGLGASGSSDALAMVKEALNSPDAAVAEAALQAYVEIGAAAAAAGANQRAIEIYTDVLERMTGPQALVVANRLRELSADIDVGALQGFVTNWWIIGPFPNANNEAWAPERHYFPEQEIALDKKYEVEGQQLAWLFHHATDPQGIVPLDQILSPTDDKAAYMYAQVVSPQAQEVRFKVGSDDGIKVWVNRELALTHNVDRDVAVDDEMFGARLREGSNDVLVEVTNGGGDWGAVVRITDAQGRPLRLEQRKP